MQQREVEVSAGSTLRANHRPRLILVWGAVILAALCAAAAFLALLLHDGSHAKLMVHDQAAPVSHSAGLSQRTSTYALARVPEKAVTAAEASRSAPKEKTAGDRLPFQLQIGKKAAAVGPLRLKLIQVKPAQGIYDVSVLSGRRAYSHRHVRVNEPLWISLSRGKGALEIVATSISQDSIEGYSVQTARSPQVKSGIRKRN